MLMGNGIQGACETFSKFEKTHIKGFSLDVCVCVCVFTENCVNCFENDDKDSN